MKIPSGTRCTRGWIYITPIIIFVVQLQLTSAGDQCPPEDKLAPCTCFHDPDLRGTAPTTPVPVVEESSSNERTRGIVLKGAEVSLPIQKEGTPLATESPLPPNATCCTVVSCNAPSSLLILEDSITSALSRKWVDKLIVSNLPPQTGHHTLVRLPRAWLKTLRVKHFEVRDTLLFGDFIHYGSPFEGQEQSMLWFTARNCYLGGSLTYDTVNGVNTKGLNYMPKIEGVDLSRNHLVHISPSAFRHPPANLSTIILSHNSIQGIDSGAFHHVPHLIRLDLSYNLLEVIARNIFAAPARKLRHIDFSWNQLKVLPNDFFVNMPQLKVVNLNNNFLTSMPNMPWASIWRQLTFVDVTNNFVLCDCSLMWLLPILSPPDAKASTTPAPVPLGGQIVLGECSFGLPNHSSTLHQLTILTRGHLNC